MTDLAGTFDNAVALAGVFGAGSALAGTFDNAVALYGSVGNRFANWYVDSVNGSDTAAGNSIDGAYKTISALTSIAENDMIALAKGSTWRESLTLPVGADNVVIYAYGTGNAPILDGSNVISAVAWSKTGGRTNVYQATITYEEKATSTCSMGIWEDDARLTWQTSLANCDSNQGSFYHALDYTGTSGTIYIHATDSSDPGSSGMEYEYTARLYQIDGATNDVDSTTIRGMHTRRNLGESGSIKLQKNATVTNCTCEDGNKHNIFIGGGSVLTSVYSLNAYFNGVGGSLFVYNQDDGNSENVTFVSCSAVQTDAAGMAAHVGFFGHWNTGPDNYSIVTMTDCTAVGMSKGIDATGHTDNYIITDFIGTDCTTALHGNDAPSVSVSGYTVTHSETGILCNAGTSTITLDGGTATIEDVGSGGAMISSTGAASITLTDSVLTINNSVATSNNFISCSDASVSITATGNTYKAPNLASGPYVYFCANGVTLASNSNAFCDADQWFRIGANSYNNVAAYQTGEGQDALSTVGGC